MSVIYADLSTALHMSYIVTQAIETPAKASISTPVFQSAFVWQYTFSPGSSSSGSISIFISLNGIVWHKGIRVGVDFAAVIPAALERVNISP